MPLPSQQADDPIFEDHKDATFYGFFLQAEHVITEAQLVIDSSPNAELISVEQTVQQLNAIKTVLLNIYDPFTIVDEQDQLVQVVEHYICPLAEFLATPEPSNGFGVGHEQPQGQGRLRYVLDLDRAYCLHQLGILWSNIVDAMEVDRKTLYNHFKKECISTTQ
jgi:hypothetical protein